MLGPSWAQVGPELASKIVQKMSQKHIPKIGPIWDRIWPPRRPKSDQQIMKNRSKIESEQNKTLF